MSMPKRRSVEHITPPSSFANQPLTPPPTEKKPFVQAPRVVALFEDIQAGKHTKQGPWLEFPLAEGEYDEIVRLLKEKSLLDFVNDKIRHDYDLDNHRLVVRMPSAVHECFLEQVEDAIRTQLRTIRSGTGQAAQFAKKVRPARSTEIYLPTENNTSTAKSKYEPDSSFWHDDAKYPGVIIEVAYSQKRRRLDRLAQNYLLDSDCSVQVVVGLDIEYGKKGTSKATLSVWRTRLVQTPTGAELRAETETTDEIFRDEQGRPTSHPGLRLRLSDFACEEMTKYKAGLKTCEITVSAQELCQYLVTAEDQMKRQDLIQHTIEHGVKKRKRSESPPDEITTSDEERYAKKERRVIEHAADEDTDYRNTFDSDGKRHYPRR